MVGAALVVEEVAVVDVLKESGTVPTAVDGLDVAGLSVDGIGDVTVVTAAAVALVAVWAAANVELTGGTDEATPTALHPIARIASAVQSGAAVAR